MSNETDSPARGSRRHYHRAHQVHCGVRAREPKGALQRTKAAIAAAYILWEERQGIRPLPARPFGSFPFVRKSSPKPVA